MRRKSGCTVKLCQLLYEAPTSHARACVARWTRVIVLKINDHRLCIRRGCASVRSTPGDSVARQAGRQAQL